MKKRSVNPEGSNNLRLKAEEQLRLRKSETNKIASKADMLKLIHELEVHQIGLELQSEELILANNQARAVSEKFEELYDFAPSGYFTLSRQGTIMEMNLCSAKMLGKERSLLINSQLGFFIKEDSRSVFAAFLEEIFRRKTNTICEVPLSCEDNNSLYLHLRGIVSENTEQCHVTATDITENKQMEENLEKYRNIVSSTQDGIAFLDKNYRYIVVNDAYEKFSGFSRELLIGMTVSDYLGEDVFQRIVKPNLDRCLHGNINNYQEWFNYPNLGRRFVDITYFPYRDSCNSIVGVISNTRDITERKQAEENLLGSAMKLARSQKIGKLGSWEWNIMDNSLEWSDEMYQIWGVGKEFALTFESIDQMIYPDDREFNLKMVQEFLANNNNGGFEFRIICPDGTIKNIYQSIETSHAPSGQPLRMFGIMQDITSRKLAEKALCESEKQYRMLAEGMADVVWILDIETMRFSYVSPSVQKLRGYTPEEVLAQPIGDSLTPESHKRINDLMKIRLPHFLAQAGKNISYVDEIDQPHKNGSIVHTEVTTSYLLNEDGKFELVGVSRDITARRMAGDKLIEMHEQLQLAYSRQSEIVEDTRKAISREIHDELGQSLSALMINLDWIHSTIQEPEIIERIDEMTSILNNTISNVQKISSDLRPNLLDDLGLAAAMEFYIQEFEKRTDIKCHFKTVDFQYPDEKINIVIYRLLQESLTNVMRHAKAENAYINVFQSVDLLTIEVVDDGTGFDLKKLNSRESLGFIGMRERIKQFNGTMEIISARNEGTRLTFKFPFNSKIIQ